MDQSFALPHLVAQLVGIVLSHCEDDEAQTWLMPHQAGAHPNDAMRAHLERCFSDLFEPKASMVHSTSWRYCQRTERLILTYLVVLPSTPGVTTGLQAIA